MEIVLENEIVCVVLDVIVIIGVIYNLYGYIIEYLLIYLIQISGLEKIVIFEEFFFINFEVWDLIKYGIGFGGLYSVFSVFIEKIMYFVFKLECLVLLYLILRNYFEVYCVLVEFMNDFVVFFQKVSVCYLSFYIFVRVFLISGNRFDKFCYSLVNLGYFEKYFSYIVVFKFEYGIEEIFKE